MFANDMRPDFCIRHTRKENASGAVKEIYSMKSSVPGHAGMNAAGLGFFACHRPSREQ